MWSRVTNWSHADTDTAQCSSHTSGQSSGSARAGDSFMGLMCVLWSRAVNCQLGPDSLTCHDIANCHKRPDLIPTQQNKPLVRLMENIDFWLPASSISPLSRVCLTKWSGVTIAVPGHKLCPGDKRGPHGDCYVCRFVIFVIRSRVKTGSSHKWPGARCRQPFTPVVCQTNVTYLVYWAFYPALRPVTWAGFGRSLEVTYPCKYSSR